MKKNEWINPELVNLNLASTKEEDSANIVKDEHCDHPGHGNGHGNGHNQLFCRKCGALIGGYHFPWCEYYLVHLPGDFPVGGGAPSAS